MKKNLKKIVSLVLALVMSAGMLAGCNKSPAGKPNDGTSGSEATSEIPTLVWWSIGGTVPADLSESLDTINKYLVEKIGAKVEIKISSWGDWEKKMNTIVNSGEYFDLMFTNTNNYNRFVSMGAFADITDMVESNTPDLYKTIPEELWKGTQVGGRIYAVPTYKDSSIAQFWCFDNKYVQKYNIDVPSIKTMKDLDAPFRAMKKGEGKGFYPLQLSQGSQFSGFFNEYDGLTAGLYPIGVKIDDKNRKVVSVLEQPEIMENLKLLNQWYKDGIINPDANVLLEAPVGLPYLSAQGWPQAVSTWQKLHGVEKYDTVKVFGPVYNTDSIQGSLNAISANSKYKEKALELLQLANTDHKFRDMLAYGIEGKHFEYVSENVVKVLTDAWFQGLPKYTQATFFNMSTEDGSDPNQWNDVKKQNEDATTSVCMGFALDISNIQNEIANCKVVWDKYRYDMMAGASDPETAVPACLKELKAAGFDTIMIEAQKQIDEFFK